MRGISKKEVLNFLINYWKQIFCEIHKKIVPLNGAKIYFIEIVIDG